MRDNPGDMEVNMDLLDVSLELIGYRVKTWQRDGFRVTGFPIVVPGGKRGGGWKDI
jgi:hypothetical protein